jgi:hypothetical protein
LKVHLYRSSKRIKSHKEVTKLEISRYGRIGIREAQKLTDPEHYPVFCRLLGEIYEIFVCPDSWSPLKAGGSCLLKVLADIFSSVNESWILLELSLSDFLLNIKFNCFLFILEVYSCETVSLKSLTFLWYFTLYIIDWRQLPKCKRPWYYAVVYNIFTNRFHRFFSSSLKIKVTFFKSPFSVCFYL